MMVRDDHEVWVHKGVDWAVSCISTDRFSARVVTLFTDEKRQKRWRPQQVPRGILDDSTSKGIQNHKLLLPLLKEMATSGRPKRRTSQRCLVSAITFY